MYAVIDTETTGLLPGHRHRVIEIAVVLLDARGQVEREWVTLLNPQRDLGPQHIHGILTSDVLAAPEFGDIAAQLGELLAGRMVVGHNVEFDLGFLRAEFARLGVTVPLITERSMCTMALVGYLYPGAKRTLGACCAAAGISIEGWHSAMADTRATAELFSQYLKAFPSPPPWQWAYEEVRRLPWPALPGTGVAPTVRPVHAGGRHGWMSRLVDQLPRVLARQPGVAAQCGHDRYAAHLQSGQDLSALRDQRDHGRGHFVQQDRIGLEPVLVEVLRGRLSGP
jgi:DNA polymerase III subunit epsilon